MKKLKFESALRIPRTHRLHWALLSTCSVAFIEHKEIYSRPSHAPCTHPHSANSQNRFGDTGSGWLPDWIHSGRDISLAQTNRKLRSQRSPVERACSVFQQGLMVDPSELWRREKKGSFLGVKISHYFWLGQSLKTCIRRSFFLLLVVLLLITFVRSWVSERPHSSQGQLSWVRYPAALSCCSTFPNPLYSQLCRLGECLLHSTGIEPALLSILTPAL